MKPAGWVGLAIIIAAMVFSARTFVTNLTPYVSFKQARQASGQVQIMGALDKASIHSSVRDLTFTIISPEGDRMPVHFVRAVPATFSMAAQVTAIGKFDGHDFQADNLLTKCPSKYQGKGGQERSYSKDGA